MIFHSSFIPEPIPRTANYVLQTTVDGAKVTSPTSFPFRQLEARQKLEKLHQAEFPI